MSTRTLLAPLPRRVLQTFGSPGTLFTSFRVHTPWAGSMALLALLAAVIAVLYPDEFFLERTQNAMTKRGKPVTITSDPAVIAQWGRMMAAMGAAAVQPLIVFGIAGLATLLGRVFLRGEGDYPQYLTVTAHALLIYAVGTLLARSVELATGATAGAEAVQHLFALWMIGVLALGVSVISRRRWIGPLALLLAAYLGAEAFAAWVVR